MGTAQRNPPSSLTPIPHTFPSPAHAQPPLPRALQYCCAIATHACRAGTKHYCQPCHDIADANFKATGGEMQWGARLAADAHRRCAASGTSARACPLGGAAHPPSGSPWSLGCSECMSTLESEKWEREAK